MHFQNIGKLPTVSEYLQIYQYNDVSDRRYSDIYFDGLLRINHIEKVTPAGSKYDAMELEGFDGTKFIMLH